MNRATRPSRPGLTGSASKSLLLSAAAGGVVLKAAPDTTTSTSLTWTEPEYKPDNYRVERSLDGTTFSTVTTLANTVFDYTDTGRTESVQYWYRIVPILGGVDGAASNIADTWTVPATPTGLTATAISSTQINLAWTDVSTGNTAQSIQRRSPAGSGSYSFIASVGATATSYSDTGLTLATQYEYQVAATNPATQSAWSTAANATTTGGGPPSPSWTLDFSSGEPWANGTNYVFSSTASTSRTFVNSSGYVAPSVANLVQQSQAFDNAYWTKTGLLAFGSGSTVDAAAAPDGTTTADLITETSGGTVHGISRNAGAYDANTSYALSIYVKKPASNARNFITLTFSGTVGHRLVRTFNMTDGTSTENNFAGTNFVARTHSATDVGSGWWRFMLSVTVGGTQVGADAIYISLSNSATPTLDAGQRPSYSGDGVSGLLIWGAQYVTGTAALPYSATTTSSNGIPRLTHNSSGSRLGLLVEGQRANLLQRSTDFSTSWLGGNTNVPADSVTAPDNLANTTSKIAANTTNAAHWRRLSASAPVTGTTYVYSVFFKAGGGAATHAVLQIETTGTTDRSYTVKYDTATGARTDEDSANSPVNTGSPAQAESYPNGWYRAWVRIEHSTGNSGIRAYAGLSNAATGIAFPTFAGAASDADFIWFWGAQVEASTTTPTSFIPTVASSVTRQADIAYVETADVTNWGRPGSFVVEYYKPLEQSGGVVVADDDGAGNAGRLGLEYSAGGPRIVYGTSGSGSGGTDTAGLNKIGWAWNGSGAATRSALNGSALDTSLATSFDPSLTDGINLGGNIDWTSLPLTVSGQPNVVIRKVQFYNSQLSAADLNTLTT